MKSLRLLLSMGLLFSTSLFCVQSYVTVSEEDIENAAKNGGTIHLTQRDFDSGTYRIKQSGYYILDGDIEFDPIPSLESARRDKPGLGWVAAMTLESDFIVVDLNGHSIKASQNFLNNHFANVFADIELDNNPFPATLFFVIPSFFQGDTGSIYAHNFVIKNGSLGRSSHWGIHGNNNSNFIIKNLVIDDFEVAGIQINGQKNGKINHIDIGPLRHPITVRSTFTAAVILTLILSQIPTPEAAFYLAQIQALIAGGTLNQPIQYPDGDLYGLNISGGLSQAPAEKTLETCISGAAASESTGTYDIDIHDINIHDIIGAPIETVAIGGLGGVPINTGAFGIFGILRWEDAFQAGVFAPNYFLQAQVYIMLAQVTANPSLIAALPAPLNDPTPIYGPLNAFQTWALNILGTLPGTTGPDSAYFYPFVEPIFGTNFNFPFFNGGVFGLGVSCGDRINICNVSMNNIQNIGQPGATLATIPGGENYPNLQQTRYVGNDVWGMQFAVQNRTTMYCSSATNIFSLNGDVFGFDVLNNSANCVFNNCLASYLLGSAECSTSVVNPPSEVYGFRVGPNVSSVCVNNSCARNLTAPCTVFGFGVESGFGTSLYECCASKLIATSSNGLSEKTVFGFSSQGSQETKFKKCKASKMAAIGAPDIAPAIPPVVAGFAFIADENGNPDVGSKVVDSKSYCNKAHGGISQAVYSTNAQDLVISRVKS